MKLQSGITFKAVNGKTIINSPVGFRDIPNQIENDIETRFPTASAGKGFVAVAILQLIEQNKLSLDAKIGEILSIDLGSIDSNVTVYQLLTHTSGVPDYCDEEKVPNYADLWIDFPNYKIRESKDLLPLFIHEKMQKDKIGTFHYNNSAFVLLGLIIEELTNKPFDIHLKEAIFNPLQMKYTGYFELDRLPNNCANAYILDEKTNEYYTNIFSVDAKGTGAGGAFTNPKDINLFWDGLVNYKLLSKKMTETMLSRQINLNGWGYGLGIWLDESNNPMLIGEDPGATFVTYYNLKNKTEITIISNMEEEVFDVLKEIKD